MFANNRIGCETLLATRIHALLFYSSTRPLYADPLKLDAFYDQIRKVFLLFGRSAELIKLGDSAINKSIKSAFEKILKVLESKQVPNQGTAWITLCEVVLHVAKRVSCDEDI